MSSNAVLELFPKKWYKKLTPAKLKDARQQLRAYAISKELDTGISEVGQFLIYLRGRIKIFYKKDDHDDQESEHDAQRRVTMSFRKFFKQVWADFKVND